MKRDQVADRFKVTNGEAHLLKYHMSRSYAALKSLEIDVTLSELEKIYNSIISKAADESGSIRVVFGSSSPLSYRFEFIPDSKIAEPVRLHSLCCPTESPLKEFKFQDRQAWDRLLSKIPENADDVLLLDRDDNLIETSRFNVFCFDEENSVYYTPPLSSGCLRGTLRSYLLEEQPLNFPVKEGHINLRWARQRPLFVGNSVRGILKAVLIN